MDGLKIGDAAVQVGVPAHVLRHWESVGLLHPPRSGSGHRAYDRQTLDQARLIRTLQRTGLSLSRIRELGRSGRGDRMAMIADERAELRRRIDLFEDTDRFLAHITECRHPIIAECPECSGFAAGHDHDELTHRTFGT
ncbi:MerR family transcriptional regulator [Nocardia vermiculata]|uniref:MerR family transcriptional regulator n=1 Tax=Nocardia vermiculata TaxID=257274 RepID=A0A846XZ08_9NOCA|nr:MerR family transcriptional regulator [Nocardia vermiculata]NKY51847.1 MerR family transcriptional regulator [Nocardia vermiculata]